MSEYQENEKDLLSEDTEPLQIPVMNKPAETISPSPAKPVVRKKRNNSAMTILICCILSLLCGFSGGFIATKLFGSSGTSVVYTTADPGTSTPSNMSTSSGTMSLQQIAAKASPSVVEILVESEQESGWGPFGGSYTAQGAGSGVITSADGYIITNHHVVENATKITVTLFDGKEYEAELIGSDKKADIGVIKINAENLVPATIGDSSKIQVGDTAVVIGNPLGTLGGTVTNGIISAASREVVINNESMEVIQTNAAINNGNSGGGLFDGNGNLIGIVNAKDSGVTSSGSTIEGLGFAIPVNTAMDVADQLIQYGSVTNRATIGVYLQEVGQKTGRYEAGLYITDIIAGSGAEAAGLQSYDRIIEADGTPISSYTDLSKVLRDKKAGDILDLKVDREGETKEFKVTLTGTISEE